MEVLAGAALATATPELNRAETALRMSPFQTSVAFSRRPERQPELTARLCSWQQSGLRSPVDLMPARTVGYVAFCSMEGQRA